MTSNKETRLAELRLEETDGKMILEVTPSCSSKKHS